MNNGIQPTIDLATNNGYGNSFFSGEGIWIVILLALMFGNNGWGGGFGGNGFNNIATTDYISSEFTQRDINGGFQNTNNAISNGFQNLSNNVSNGFASNATNICNLRSDILTGNMGIQNSIMDSKYANQLAESQTQRDILLQTTQLENQAGMNALTAANQLSSCCCELKSQGIENTQKILDVLNQNTIDDLRSQVNDLKNTITANGIGTSIVNQVRPYPIPSYTVSSPYVGLYNGFYGSNWYGNTIV